MRAWVLVAVCACSSTNRSTLPPYVRDLRAIPGGVEMIQCEVIVTTTREHNWINGNTSRTREISTGQCWNQAVSTEPPAVQP
jgi:hypothetical protein